MHRTNSMTLCGICSAFDRAYVSNSLSRRSDACRRSVGGPQLSRSLELPLASLGRQRERNKPRVFAFARINPLLLERYGGAVLRPTQVAVRLRCRGGTHLKYSRSAHDARLRCLHSQYPALYLRDFRSADASSGFKKAPSTPSRSARASQAAMQKASC
jgi:hypothetical protein